jgi:hypothetical protein
MRSGVLPPPAEGARSDVAFEEPVTGPKAPRHGHRHRLRPSSRRRRADLHIHATITTGDGKTISLAADGAASIEPEP